MHTTNDCLQEAMLIASESYSGSTYETDFSEAPCEERFVMAIGEDAIFAAPLAA